MARHDAATLAALQALTESQRELTTAVKLLADEQAELTRVQSAQLTQQTATNYIIRAQIATDPDEKRSLMEQAHFLMESRRAKRHRRDLLTPPTFPERT